MSDPRLDAAWRLRLLELLAPADSRQWNQARAALCLRQGLDAMQQAFAFLCMVALFGALAFWIGFAFAQAAHHLDLADKASQAGRPAGLPMFYGLGDIFLGLFGLAASLGMLREAWGGPTWLRLGLSLLALCAAAFCGWGCWVGIDAPWGLLTATVFGLVVFLTLFLPATLFHHFFIDPLEQACSARLWLAREQWSAKLRPLCEAEISAPDDIELASLLREALKTKKNKNPPRPWTKRALVWIDGALKFAKPPSPRSQFARLDLSQLECLASGWRLSCLGAEKERQALLLAAPDAPKQSPNASRL